MQYSNSEVELSRYAQYKQEIRNDVADEITNVNNIFRGHNQVVIDESIKDEVNSSPEHPYYTGLIDLIGVFLLIIGSSKCGIIDYGKKRENNIR
jgi:hypothetical protein